MVPRTARSGGVGGLAEFEREPIQDSTGEGRARVMAAGRKLGPALRLTPRQRQEARKRREARKTITAIAQSYAVHRSTISRVCA